MTRIVPCRLMMRQRSHMVLTDGRTFISGNHSKKQRICTHSKAGAVNQRSKAAPALVRIRGPSAVSATVCSKWAASDSSTEEIDQSSSCT